jgi:hypothetical protein
MLVFIVVVVVAPKRCFIFAMYPLVRVFVVIVSSRCFISAMCSLMFAGVFATYPSIVAFGSGVNYFGMCPLVRTFVAFGSRINYFAYLLR